MKRLGVVILLAVMVVLVSCAAPPQVSPEDYARVNADLTAAQGQVRTLQTALDVAQSQNQSLQNDLTSARAQVKTLQGNLDAAQSQVKTAQTNLETVKSQVATLQSALDAARSQASIPQTSTQLALIASLQGQLQTATDKVAQVKLEIDLVNKVWTNVRLGIAFDGTIVRQWRDQAAGIKDAAVQGKLTALVQNLDYASAIDLLNTSFLSISTLTQ